MEQKFNEIERALSNIDTVLSQVRNPALNRQEHVELANAIAVVHNFVKEQKKATVQNGGASPVKEQAKDVKNNG